MPNTIKHKKSTTAGLVPGTGSIDQAELAINIADGKLYTKNSGNSIINLGVTSISGTYITPNSGNFSNSLRLNGNEVLTSIIQDTNAQLGSNLDLNSYNINGNAGDIIISGNVSAGNVIPGTIISLNDFDGGTPGTIGVGEFTTLAQTFWSIDRNGSGNFSSLSINNTGVSLNGHSHTISDISTFASSALASRISDETGSGSLVFSDEASLINPSILGALNIGDGVNYSPRFTIAGDNGNFLDITSTPSARAIYSIPIEVRSIGGGTIEPLVLKAQSADFLGLPSDIVGVVASGHWRGATICTDKGGTGRTSYSNGQLLIGSGTSLAANTLTAGTGISITNGSGTITINATGVALYNTTVFDLGTISGTNSINCGQDRQIQTLTLNGTATTFTKGTGWPTSDTVARETTLNIYASGNTSITWTIVNDWYRQPDSPLPSGRHIVLLRSVGSGTMQGHYIGNKTN